MPDVYCYNRTPAYTLNVALRFFKPLFSKDAVPPGKHAKWHVGSIRWEVTAHLYDALLPDRQFASRGGSGLFSSSPSYAISPTAQRTGSPDGEDASEETEEAQSTTCWTHGSYTAVGPHAREGLEKLLAKDVALHKPVHLDHPGQKKGYAHHFCVIGGPEAWVDPASGTTYVNFDKPFKPMRIVKSAENFVGPREDWADEIGRRALEASAMENMFDAARQGRVPILPAITTKSGFCSNAGSASGSSGDDENGLGDGEGPRRPSIGRATTTGQVLLSPAMEGTTGTGGKRGRGAGRKRSATTTAVSIFLTPASPPVSPSSTTGPSFATGSPPPPPLAPSRPSAPTRSSSDSLLEYHPSSPAPASTDPAENPRNSIGSVLDMPGGWTWKKANGVRGGV